MASRESRGSWWWHLEKEESLLPCPPLGASSAAPRVELAANQAAGLWQLQAVPAEWSTGVKRECERCKAPIKNLRPPSNFRAFIFQCKNAAVRAIKLWNKQNMLSERTLLKYEAVKMSSGENLLSIKLHIPRPFLPFHFRSETLLNFLLESAEGWAQTIPENCSEGTDFGASYIYSWDGEPWRLHQENQIWQNPAPPTPKSENQKGSKGWQTHRQEPDWQFFAFVVTNCYTVWTNNCNNNNSYHLCSMYYAPVTYSFKVTMYIYHDTVIVYL